MDEQNNEHTIKMGAVSVAYGLSEVRAMRTKKIDLPMDTDDHELFSQYLERAFEELGGAAGVEDYKNHVQRSLGIEKLYAQREALLDALVESKKSSLSEITDMPTDEKQPNPETPEGIDWSKSRYSKPEYEALIKYAKSRRDRNRYTLDDAAKEANVSLPTIKRARDYFIDQEMFPKGLVGYVKKANN